MRNISRFSKNEIKKKLTVHLLNKSSIVFLSEVILILPKNAKLINWANNKI